MVKQFWDHIKMLFGNKPVPGKDAQWLAWCRACDPQGDDLKLFASRGGYKLDGIESCYSCGQERKTTGLKQSDIDRNIVSSWSHWQKYPIIPYNYHELTEEERLALK